MSAQSLLQAASDGYARRPPHAQKGTPDWMAHRAGQAMDVKGFCQPTRVFAPRGRKIRIQTAANDFTLEFGSDFDTINNFVRD